MLVPAILHKDEILKKFKEYYYTDDMMYETSSLDNWSPEIFENPNQGNFQYAIIDSKKNVVGYIAFYIDWYSQSAYNFGILSFDRGNPAVGEALSEIMGQLLHVYMLHRIEWRMVGGNPIEKHYDAFCDKYNGRKIELRDVFKDKRGKYRNCYIYEIIQP